MGANANSSPTKVYIQLGFIATTGFSMLLILPIILGGLVDYMNFTNVQIGRVAASNSLGIALGALYVPLSGSRFRLARSLQLSLVLLLFVDIGCYFVQAPNLLYLMRFIAGCFGGVLYAGVLRAIAGLPFPEKGFSIYVIVYCAWASVLYYIAPFILKAYGVSALFIYISISTLISLALSGALKDVEVIGKELENLGLARLVRQKSTFAALVAYMLLMAGCGAFWAYVERMGVSHNFSSTFIGLALSTSNLSGIPAGFLVYYLGTKKGLLAPLLVGILLLALSAISTGYYPTRLSYMVSTFIFGGVWGMLIAYFQKVQAMVDKAGKIVALGATLNLLGRAFGQGTVGLFLTDNGYHPVIWYALFVFAFSTLLIIPVAYRLDREEKQLISTT